jgi:hypothetical protein
LFSHPHHEFQRPTHYGISGSSPWGRAQSTAEGFTEEILSEDPGLLSSHRTGFTPGEEGPPPGELVPERVSLRILVSAVDHDGAGAVTSAPCGRPRGGGAVGGHATRRRGLQMGLVDGHPAGARGPH